MKCLKRHKIQSSNFLIRFKGHKITLKLLQDLNTFYPFVHLSLYRSVTNSSQTGRHPQTTVSSTALAFCYSECVLRTGSSIWELARNVGFQAMPQGYCYIWKSERYQWKGCLTCFRGNQNLSSYSFPRTVQALPWGWGEESGEPLSFHSPSASGPASSPSSLRGPSGHLKHARPHSCLHSSAVSPTTLQSSRQSHSFPFNLLCSSHPDFPPGPQ